MIKRESNAGVYIVKAKCFAVSKKPQVCNDLIYKDLLIQIL